MRAVRVSALPRSPLTHHTKLPGSPSTSSHRTVLHLRLLVSLSCLRAKRYSFSLTSLALPSARIFPSWSISSSLHFALPFLRALLSAPRHRRCRLGSSRLLSLSCGARTTGELFLSMPWVCLFQQLLDILASACRETARSCHLGASGITKADVSTYALPVCHPHLASCICTSSGGHPQGHVA